ncbi:MAG: NUDIX domain-containing protein [Gemmatimonadaceae bacterium]
MAKRASAGVLLYRRQSGLEVLLVHPGGPNWARKDLGAWTLPKGEVTEDEDPRAAAQREFEEETGCALGGVFQLLVPIKQPSGKVIHAWAVEGECDAAAVRSNTFALEWPPKSGRMQEFLEVDRAAWFDIPEARRRILAGQVGFLEQLVLLLGAYSRGDRDDIQRTPPWPP